MLRIFSCIVILTFFFLVGIAAHKSWIEPIGHIQPQNIRFENNKTKSSTAIKRNGNAPPAMEMKIYSNIPAPLEKGFRGEFCIGKNLVRPSKLIRLIGKNASRMM
jgi:hypothetical protein